jgi:hypothetical protein
MAADRCPHPIAAVLVAVLLLVAGPPQGRAQAAAGGGVAGGASALAEPPVGSVASTHAWFDGGVRRPLAIVPSLRADFADAMRGGPVVLRPVTGVTKEALGPLQSPVLRDESGRLRALPGGVLVVLDAVRDEASARELFARYGVVSARPVAGRTWLVDAPAGLGSLELANRLAATGAFASAQPNWWVERVRK